MDPENIRRRFHEHVKHNLRNKIGFPKDTGVDISTLWNLQFKRASELSLEDAQKLEAWLASHPVETATQESKSPEPETGSTWLEEQNNLPEERKIGLEGEREETKTPELSGAQQEMLKLLKNVDP